MTTQYLRYPVIGTGSGTVTSVGLSLPASVFSVSGSPVTTTGTLTGAFISQSANLVFASPNGAPGVPTFRALVTADLPAGTGTVTAVTASSPLASSGGSTPNITIQDAGAAQSGVVNTGIQSFGGNKTFTGTIAASNFSGSSSGTNTGDVTLAPVGSSPNANGASLSGQVLTLQPADFSDPGLMVPGDQSFQGIKTFDNLQLVGQGAGPLKLDGSSNFYTAAIDLSSPVEVTNILSTGNGGTSADNSVSAFNNLSPLSTLGDTLYHDWTYNVSLPGQITTTKKFLTQTGTGAVSAAPIWNTIVAGDIPTLNQNTTGTASNVTGIVAADHGGTGQSSLTANNVILGNGTSPVQFVAPGTSGNVLTSNGTSWISSPASSSGFAAPTTYTLTVGSTGTPPTKGSITSDIASYTVSGKMMKLSWVFVQGAGSAGTGTYLFPIPGGFTIDTTNQVASTTAPYNASRLGSGFVSEGAGTNTMPTIITAYDGSNLLMSYVSGTALLSVGAGNFDMSAPLTYTIDAFFAIV